MKSYRQRLITALLALGVIGVAAQGAAAQATTGQITGRVTAAATNRPIEQAQISVVGQRIGMTTQRDGRFLILNVPTGTYQVRAEFLGFGARTDTVTVTAGATTTVNFSLAETAVSLEAIVVTGTAAEVRAREVGNSLDAVTAREIENVPILNAEQMLRGRVPNLMVLGGSGQPGAGGTVRIRGQTTASQTPEPLIYVDGIRMYNLPISLGGAARSAVTPLQDINAEDIDRIEVIKGASATTLYGTEASGGVIQVFTKRGANGAPIWTGEMTLGMSRMGQIGPDGDPTDLFTNCGNTEALYGLSQSRSTLGERVFFEDPTCPSSGDWFETGMQQGYNLAVRGGSETIGYFLSGNYGNVEGTLPTQFSKDGGFRGNFDLRPIDDLTISLNSSYTRRNSRFVEDGNNANGFLLNVGRGTNGNFKGGREDDCANVEVLCVSNGYLMDSENTARSDRYLTGLVLQYSPIENLANRLAIGWDYWQVESEEWEPWGYLRAPGGFYSSEGQSRSKLSLDYASSLSNSFGESLRSTFSWGGQIFRDEARAKFVSTRDFAGPGRPTLVSGGGSTGVEDSQIAQTNAGVFLQELLGWNDRLFLTGGLRVDGNSAFGDDFGLQYYPKLSVAWVVSDHDFWPLEQVEAFKLRGAVGESGKAPGVFDKLRTWSPVTGDEGTAGFTPGEIGNREVGPERTRELEFGFDAGAFDGRLGFEATWYSTRTTDALVPVTFPPSEGFLAARTENVGEIKGNGMEFQVSALFFRNDMFEWRARANLGFNDTEAVDLKGQDIFADNKAGIREGDAVPSYYGTRIMNPNEFADPILVDDTIIGAVNPTRMVGLGTTINIGQRLTVDGLIEHQGGHYLPQYTGYQNSRRGAWYPCYDIQAKLIARSRGDEAAVADVRAIDRAKCAMNALGGYNSDFWVEKADFWKLRNIGLTYNVPENFISSFASRASITVAGSNLITWTDYSGVDPEVEDFADRAETGVYDGAGDYGRREYYNLPAPRSYVLSFRFTF